MISDEHALGEGEYHVEVPVISNGTLYWNISKENQPQGTKVYLGFIRLTSKLFTVVITSGMGHNQQADEEIILKISRAKVEPFIRSLINIFVAPNSQTIIKAQELLDNSKQRLIEILQKKGIPPSKINNIFGAKGKIHVEMLKREGLISFKELTYILSLLRKIDNVKKYEVTISKNYNFVPPEDEDGDTIEMHVERRIGTYEGFSLIFTKNDIGYCFEVSRFQTISGYEDEHGDTHLEVCRKIFLNYFEGAPSMDRTKPTSSSNPKSPVVDLSRIKQLSQSSLLDGLSKLSKKL